MSERPPAREHTLDPGRYDAVIFDLDGVITRTARVHARAWKAMFDEFLERLGAERGEPLPPFDEVDEYRRYVDGRPRTEGVVSFLAARGIELPAGQPDDPPGARTVHGLGNRKNALFLSVLEGDGVEVFESSLTLVRELHAAGVRTAVVSSSKNCVPVLRAAGALDLFDARVDGLDAERLGLRGKPAADAFLEAARQLGVRPERAVVVEDAISGVAAGRAGGFGRVIGVDRAGQSKALRAAGADVVVGDLAEIAVANTEAAVDVWTLEYPDFDPSAEGLREALCTLGNGYFATRGAAPEASADGVHYPGTYLAGGYNRLSSEVGGRVVESEDLVNLPNWLPLSVRIGGDTWLDLGAVEVLEYRQALDLRRGVLERAVRLRDAAGRCTRLAQRRLVHMAAPHLAALETLLTAENWSGTVEVRSALDARVVNAGVGRYRGLANRHLEPIEAEAASPDTLRLKVRTTQSRLEVALAARTRVYQDGERAQPELRVVQEEGYLAHELAIGLDEGESVRIEKIVSLYTSRDHAISECARQAVAAVGRAGAFEALLASHVMAWAQLWQRFDIVAEEASVHGGVRGLLVLRLHLFHLLQTASPNTMDLDVGVPARGWHGEAYRGHVFWDELFVFPLLNLRLPEITRALLRYRYRRLDEARANARAAGFRGAMYPWQSGSDGREESQRLHLNPRSRRWVPDHTHLQRHVNAAVAYNVWQYYQVTRDTEFLAFYGAEVILEVARFWASVATYNQKLDRYEILGVVGPDEFHTAYPGSERPGLDNNAYTNVMAVWVLCRALEVLDLLPAQRRREIRDRLGIEDDELAHWREVSGKMRVVFHDDGIISQFEGYQGLEELDWEGYRRRYGDIHRLDRLLEAEGDSSNRYKASKQADVLMLFYLFSAEELGELFTRLGYPFPADTIPRNVEYYARRTSHGSTLSRVVYAWVLSRLDRPRAWRLFREALESDIADIQGGTTAEGIHLGAMAGTVDLVQRCFTGMVTRGDTLWLNPCLPQALTRLEMSVRYRGHTLRLRLTSDTLEVYAQESAANPIQVGVGEELHELRAGGTLRLARGRAADPRPGGSSSARSSATSRSPS